MGPYAGPRSTVKPPRPPHIGSHADIAKGDQRTYAPQTSEHIMADSETADLSKLLPEAIHQSVKPGTALLRLETTRSREGILDGAWWPRSRNIGAELPSLISALTEHLGPVLRVGLDTNAWEELPTRLIIDDRVVHIDSFPVGDDTVLITLGDQDYFSLLVVPPQATPEAAAAAMARAVRADNVAQAGQILVDTGTGPARTSPADDHEGGRGRSDSTWQAGSAE